MVNKKATIILIGIILMMFSGCSMLNTTPSDQYLNKQQFIQEEGKLSITEYELDETFPISSFIGYTNEYIYILHYEEEDAIISRINYIEKYIEEEIYRTNAKIIFSYHVNNDILYIGEAENQENHLVSVLKYIEIENPNNTYRERELFRTEEGKLPEITYSEDCMVINYVKDGSRIVEYMNYDRKEFIQIYRADFEITKGNLYKGDIPLNANATEEGIYFQIITLNNERIDFEGTQMLYFYSFESKKYMPKLKLSDKITYSKGNEDMVVVNNYSVDDARALTGKIILLKENSVIDIPETRPANSISNSLIGEEHLFINSYRNIYIYDIQKKSFTSMEVVSGSTQIRMFKDTFGFIENPQGKNPIFKVVGYKND